MDNRPIGVFDSGLGGLTCVKELMHVLPGENIIYLGDTGRVPYGTRSNETIIQYALEGVAFLEKFDVKRIIIACGTVSTVAMEQVRQHARVATMGSAGSHFRKAVALTKNKKVGSNRNLCNNAQPGLPQPAFAARSRNIRLRQRLPALCTACRKRLY